MVPYINPTNHTPGVQIGYTLGVISSHRITIGKLKKKLQSFYVLCVAMFSNPLYRSCQPCTWGPNWPCPKGIICPKKYFTYLTCWLSGEQSLPFGLLVFSSPEQKAQGELIVYRSSRRLAVCLWTFSNSNISATSGPIVKKFYLKHHWGGGKAALGFGPDLWCPWQRIAPIGL